jgi:hypothetical protein
VEVDDGLLAWSDRADAGLALDRGSGLGGDRGTWQAPARPSACALAWEWRDWCDFHYIADPDTFFGHHADYLMSVLLQREYMGMMVPSAHGFIARGGFGSSRRCAANVEFDPLSAGEASEWLAAHGAADGASTQMTLAELYARAEGREASETHLVGFGDDGR